MFYEYPLQMNMFNSLSQEHSSAMLSTPGRTLHSSALSNSCSKAYSVCKLGSAFPLLLTTGTANLLLLSQLLSFCSRGHQKETLSRSHAVAATQPELGRHLLPQGCCETTLKHTDITKGSVSFCQTKEQDEDVLTSQEMCRIPPGISLQPQQPCTLGTAASSQPTGTDGGAASWMNPPTHIVESPI